MNSKNLMGVTQRLEQLIAENNYHTWGRAAQIIETMRSHMSNEYSRRDAMTRLMGMATVGQVLGGMRETHQQQVNNYTFRAGTNFTERGFSRDFARCLWFNLPTVMSEASKKRLMELARQWAVEKDVLGQTHEPFVQLMDTGHDTFNMPGFDDMARAVVIEEFWDAHMSKLPNDIINDMMACTRNLIESCLEALRQDGVVTHVQQNLGMLNKQFQLGHGDTREIDAMEWHILLHHSMATMSQPYAWRALAKELLPNTWPMMLHELDRISGQEPGRAASLVGYDSWISRMGLCEDTPEIDEWLENKKQLVNKEALATLVKGFATTAGLLDQLGLDESRLRNIENALPLTAFEFLGNDVDNLVGLMKSAMPMRVLVVGPNGSGKTALIDACAKAAGRNVLVCDRALLLSQWRGGRSLEALRKQARLHENCILCLDPGDVWLMGKMEHNEAVATLRETMSGERALTHEVWTINSLSQIESETVKMFDLVVQVTIMPLIQRQALAQNYFPETVARQLARACSLPGEIASTIQWSQATGQQDWPQLSSRLMNLQQSSIKSKESTGELPVQLFPPKVGAGGFEEVAGAPQLVKQARRIIGGMRDPERYKAMGVSPPKGVLLTGGPGCGKTHLARAMAAEAGVSLLLADSAAMARAPESIAKVFAEARRQSPCLLFLDELDAIGTRAQGAFGASPDPERQAILNRLLTELDGFEGLDGVLVVGATHRSDLLDDALVRSGRLGVHFRIEDPTRHSRQAIWEHYGKQVNCADTINWERLGRISAGMTPADIAQAVKMAALQAVEDGQDRVGMKHLRDAIDDSLWGDNANDLPMQEDELWRTSVHEAGHALLAWYNRSDIERVSVRPRSSALGFVRTIPEEGRYGKNPGDILSHLAMLFGGMGAEIVMFGEHSTGNSMDLQMARSMARRAIRGSGMSDKVAAAGLAGPCEASVSQHTLSMVEQAEEEMLRSMRNHAVTWLGQQRAVLEEFAKYLMDQRELDGEEVMTWLAARMPQNARAPRDVRSTDLTQAAKTWPTMSGVGGVHASSEGAGAVPAPAPHH